MKELLIDGMKNRVLVILGFLKREAQVGSWQTRYVSSLQIDAFG